MKEWLREHHAGYLAVLAIVICGYLIYHEIAQKPFYDIKNAKIIEAPKFQDIVLW
jgi:hypothetical protein